MLAWRRAKPEWNPAVGKVVLANLALPGSDDALRVFVATIAWQFVIIPRPMTPSEPTCRIGMVFAASAGGDKFSVRICFVAGPAKVPWRPDVARAWVRGDVVAIRLFFHQP